MGNGIRQLAASYDKLAILLVRHTLHHSILTVAAGFMLWRDLYFCTISRYRRFLSVHCKRSPRIRV